MEKIDVFEVVRIIIKRWWVLALCFVICGTAGFAYSEFGVTKRYNSIGRMYIDTYRRDVSGSSEGEAFTRSIADINASQRTVLTCIEVIKSRRVLQKVADESGLDYTAGQLHSMITLKSANETEVLEVKVTSANPDDTKVIVDTLMDVATIELKDIVGVPTVNILDEGTKSSADSPIYPDVKLQTAVAAFAGLLDRKSVV